MTWSLVGWAFIGLSATMLMVYTLLFKTGKLYFARRFPAVERLKSSRVRSLEGGKKRGIIIGHQLWSRSYPGLGLEAISALPVFIDAENSVEGGQVVSTSDGSLLVLARQVTLGKYQGGFSKPLSEVSSSLSLLGMTPLSFTAGVLMELKNQPYGSLALFGNYGPEAALWVGALANNKAFGFAAAGSLSSQAALFLSVRDLMIAEEVFLLPGLIRSRSADQAGWLTEDSLRILLILLLILGAVLKMVGIL
jgi:hypothetical protein